MPSPILDDNPFDLPASTNTTTPISNPNPPTAVTDPDPPTGVALRDLRPQSLHLSPFHPTHFLLLLRKYHSMRSRNYQSLWDYRDDFLSVRLELMRRFGRVMWDYEDMLLFIGGVDLDDWKARMWKMFETDRFGMNLEWVIGDLMTAYVAWWTRRGFALPDRGDRIHPTPQALGYGLGDARRVRQP